MQDIAFTRKQRAALNVINVAAKLEGRCELVRIRTNNKYQGTCTFTYIHMYAGMYCYSSMGAFEFKILFYMKRAMSTAPRRRSTYV
jgi:hypothetical protein